jgi:hypothetical protein
VQALRIWNVLADTLLPYKINSVVTPKVNPIIKPISFLMAQAGSTYWPFCELVSLAALLCMGGLWRLDMEVHNG